MFIYNCCTRERKEAESVLGCSSRFGLKLKGNSEVVQQCESIINLLGERGEDELVLEKLPEGSVFHSDGSSVRFESLRVVKLI